MPTLYAYGADYTGGEFTPAELDAYHAAGGYDIRVLLRRVGYPGDPRCVSHYPGAYRSLTDSGRLVLLVHGIDANDPAGGRDAGVQHATAALDDARRLGYPEELPIFMAAGDWLARQGISVPTAMAYLEGAAAVLGIERTGAHGFADVVHAAQDQAVATWFWLRGAESGVREGIQLYRAGDLSPVRPTTFDIDLDQVYFDPHGIAGGGFLMALEQWKQDRIFERILSMSQQVDGQTFDGDQFTREQRDRQLVQSKLDTLTQQMQARLDTLAQQGQSTLDTLAQQMQARLDALSQQNASTLDALAQQIQALAAKLDALQPAPPAQSPAKS
ncbi:glycoside hydrolase domain-containing protein [Kutzneria sp. NPDC052558]|uniref:glycoside hydrolase domain-containing protein n=1 Tax=Kutzneria sp. NPDC052558 TaxID=3364121 RepID=UPI0037CB8C38